MKISELQEQSWQVAESKGFHDGRSDSRDDTLVRLCLVHSEVTEAVQLVKRHWTPEALACEGTDSVLAKFADELADVLIRVGDLAGCCGVDLEAAVVRKMAANRERPHLYGTPKSDGAA